MARTGKAKSRFFGAGQYRVEIIASAEVRDWRLINVRDRNGSLVGDLHATWSTAQSADELIALLPAEHGATQDQLAAIVAFARDPSGA